MYIVFYCIYACKISFSSSNFLMAFSYENGIQWCANTTWGLQFSIILRRLPGAFVQNITFWTPELSLGYPAEILAVFLILDLKACSQRGGLVGHRESSQCSRATRDTATLHRDTRDTPRWHLIAMRKLRDSPRAPLVARACLWRAFHSPSEFISLRFLLHPQNHSHCYKHPEMTSTFPLQISAAEKIFLLHLSFKNILLYP